MHLNKTQLYTLMHQSHKIKAAPKFKLRCGFYFKIFCKIHIQINYIGSTNTNVSSSVV